MEWLVKLAAVEGFLPHGYCFQWSPQRLSLMVGSDLAVVAAYYSIPVALVAFVRARKDVRFNGVFWLFAAFIFLCGTTHLVDVATIWYPAYWVHAYTKLATAIVSAATAVALWVLMPKLLKLPSNDQLTSLVSQLELEVAQRREAQERLDQLNEELERRVQDRTRELEAAERERERLKDADRARELAEAKDRAKSEFLSRMSHELRTPLNAVLGFTQLLGMEAHRGQLSTSQLDWIERTHGAGKHLLSLVDELLDMARIEARGLEIRSEPVDLAAMARECEGLLAHAALERDVSVAISVEGQRQMVSSDPRRLRQVLMNLLSNAIKYNRRGGKVEARMRLDGAELHLEVNDTGIGMTAEQTGQLFAPFNRLGKETDQRYPGTGLGLAITKQVVEALGGHISVSSSPDAGSEFLVVLPVAPTR